MPRTFYMSHQLVTVGLCASYSKHRMPLGGSNTFFFTVPDCTTAEEHRAELNTAAITANKDDLRPM